MKTMSPTACNHPRMKRMNQVSLLRLLRIHGAISRVQLAAEMGVDTKTVTNLIRDLIRQGLVREAATVPIARGRPRRMLRLASSHLRAIGIHLAEKHLTGAIVNLEGDILDRQELALAADETQPILLDKIRQLAVRLLRVASPKHLGIGLAFPGILDRQRGLVLECDHLPAWNGVRIAEILQGVYQGRFVFEDYVHAKVLAEQWFGSAQYLQDFLFLNLGVGIGAAVVKNGKILSGASHLWGEIGHSIFQPNGRLCWCGRRGCLETVASLDAIRQAIHQGLGTPVAELTPPSIQKLLSEENPVAIRALQEAMTATALVVANLINVLGPMPLIVTGETTVLGNVIVSTLNTALAEFTIPVFYKALDVMPGKLNQDAALLGAAVIALQSVFED